ncbi:hypothetical protein AXG93_1513s1100 [Marchantia polymorpha subsp. ruderalis]|uniref:Uncharacterized protein n=1 Tax=Marchantia polymorpha subsp. ruderalis TaxID=1480154 RepID=A0A176W9T1_MARPO|nr:hypothetical protein AXG93_1513s1100 [Marchantia polymorpha subsp. ruderalis]
MLNGKKLYECVLINSIYNGKILEIREMYIREMVPDLEPVLTAIGARFFALPLIKAGDSVVSGKEEDGAAERKAQLSGMGQWAPMEEGKVCSKVLLMRGESVGVEPGGALTDHARIRRAPLCEWQKGGSTKAADKGDYYYR